MPTKIEAGELDLSSIVEPGDTILWGQGTGEPLTLTESLVRQRNRLGGVSVFFGALFSDTLQAEHATRSALLL